ncbi:MAG TPA: tryptophan synthase subunit alpha [Candidatus Nitrosotalea sp.]|nr:tryptophan synthase subunit alpha [Candidatus Nitrosotalea sp.]
MPVSSVLEAALRGGQDLKVIAYVMAGHPSRQESIELGRALVRAGAAAIEVGVPFSDPLADGPVIQRAGQQALAGGTTLIDAIAVAEEIALEGAPVVIMTYVNPVLTLGPRVFVDRLVAAGVAGVIVPDLPLEEADLLAPALADAGVDLVQLVAPTSPAERVARIVAATRGFVYCVTLTGVTGGRSQLAEGLDELLDRVRAQSPRPVAAGFGISRPEHVRHLRGRVDAVVVASAVIDLVGRGDPPGLIRDMVAAGRS